MYSTCGILMQANRNEAKFILVTAEWTEKTPGLTKPGLTRSGILIHYQGFVEIALRLFLIMLF